MNEDLRIALISVGTSVVTTIITFLITSKWQRRQDKGERKRQEVEDRLNPSKNVRRKSVTYKTDPMGASGRSSVRHDYWFINPYWIEVSGDTVSLVGNSAAKLTEMFEVDGRFGTELHPFDLSAKAWTAAKERRDWMKFREVDELVLQYVEAEPSSAEDQHLFQPLPEQRRGLAKLLSPFS